MKWIILALTILSCGGRSELDAPTAPDARADAPLSCSTAPSCFVYECHKGRCCVEVDGSPVCVPAPDAGGDSMHRP
jgi:hypothetical protein